MTRPADAAAFAGSVPDIYESAMVPLLFAPYADEMAGRIAALAPQRVLETAAGTGALTRALAARLPSAAITATDLNPPMLERARAVGGAPGVQWQTADAMALPFANAAFDLVCCQFGVMFFPDKAAAHAQVRRVLRPGGTWLFSVWDALAHNGLTAVVNDALARCFPADPPLFMQRGPHGYFDRELIAAHVTGGGFAAAPRIDTVTLASRAPSPLHAATALCQGTPLSAEIAGRGANLAEVTAACAAAIEQRFGPGPVDQPMQALVVTVRG